MFLNPKEPRTRAYGLDNDRARDAQRIQGAHHVSELRRRRQLDQHAWLVFDLNVRLLGHRGLPTRQGVWLADRRSAADTD